MRHIQATAYYLTDKGIEAVKYLIFAKKCEQFATSHNPPMKMNGTLWVLAKKMTKPQFMQTAKDGNHIICSNAKQQILNYALLISWFVYRIMEVLMMMLCVISILMLSL
jgi:hypothetical protein